MIVGRNDTYYTVAEFAAMVDREPKTIENWAATGRIRFVHLCSVPLISLSTVESMITGRPIGDPADGDRALRIIGRRAPGGRIAPPERRRRDKSESAPRVRDVARNPSRPSSILDAPPVVSPRP